MVTLEIHLFTLPQKFISKLSFPKNLPQEFTPRIYLKSLPQEFTSINFNIGNAFKFDTLKLNFTFIRIVYLGVLKTKINLLLL